MQPWSRLRRSANRLQSWERWKVTNCAFRKARGSRSPRKQVPLQLWPTGSKVLPVAQEEPPIRPEQLIPGAPNQVRSGRVPGVSEPVVLLSFTRPGEEPVYYVLEAAEARGVAASLEAAADDAARPDQSS